MRSIIFLFAVILLSGCTQLDQALLKANQTVTQPDRITGKTSISYADRSTQIKQGNQIADQYLQDYKNKGININEDADAESYVRLKEIMNRILSVSHLDGESGWQLYLIEDKSFNAFVTGGTKVFVFTGLLNIAKTDDEIAAILGHEIGHIAADHMFEKATYNLVALATKSKSSRTDLFQKSFTTAQEKEADKVGLLYAALAGYDPKAASQLWSKMLKIGGNNGGLVSSHPINSERLKNTKAIAEQISSYYKAGQINPNHAEILDNNFLWQKNNTAAKTGVGATLNTAIDYYLKRDNAKSEAKKQTARISNVKFVRDNIKVLNIEKINGNTLEATIMPKQTIKSQSTTFYIPISAIDRIFYTLNGVMYGGSVYKLQFSDSRLNTDNIDLNKISVGVDDSQPAS